MSTHQEKPQSIQPDSEYAAEQTFRAWATRRLELYRETEQQVQNGIEHMLQLASELTRKMEEEAEQLIARYQREREIFEREIDTLRQELQTMRVAMAEERLSHQDRLKRERQRHDADLQQQQQQANEKIERQMAEANVQHERFLTEAYADRDRVLEETRQLSEQLGVLRQSLQGLLGSASPQPELSRSAAMPSPAKNQTQSDSLDQSLVSEEQSEDGSMLHVENVGSISQASELMDSIAQHEAVMSATLISFEHELLVLALDHDPSLKIADLLREEFADQVEVIEARPDATRLRYKS